MTSAASGIRYPHRFALKGGWTACRTAALVSSERGAVRTFTRHPFLPVRGNTPLRRTGGQPPCMSRREPSAAPCVGGSESVTGIEPAYPPWQGGVLPLNYTDMYCISQSTA